MTVDDAFLDYMAHSADGIAIELWAQRRDISAERVASARLPLAALLQRADGRMEGHAALFAHENEAADDGSRTDTVVAQVGTIAFKLALLRPMLVAGASAAASVTQTSSAGNSASGNIITDSGNASADALNDASALPLQLQAATSTYRAPGL